MTKEREEQINKVIEPILQIAKTEEEKALLTSRVLELLSFLEADIMAEVVKIPLTLVGNFEELLDIGAIVQDNFRPLGPQVEEFARRLLGLRNYTADLETEVTLLRREVRLLREKENQQ